MLTWDQQPLHRHRHQTADIWDERKSISRDFKIILFPGRFDFCIKQIPDRIFKQEQAFLDSWFIVIEDIESLIPT
jgi:hypothetical protein